MRERVHGGLPSGRIVDVKNQATCHVGSVNVLVVEEKKKKSKAQRGACCEDIEALS